MVRRQREANKAYAGRAVKSVNPDDVERIAAMAVALDDVLEMGIEGVARGARLGAKTSDQLVNLVLPRRWDAATDCLGEIMRTGRRDGAAE